MTDAKWTPGPWSVGFGGQTGRPMTVNPVLRWGSIAKPATAEAEANARLIAAAPDLAEALRLAIPFLRDSVDKYGIAWREGDPPVEGDPEDVVVLRAAKAALAKAEGGSND